MPGHAVRTAIGTMSGTSMDGIDLALVRSDGVTLQARGPGATYPYRPETRAALVRLVGGRQEIGPGDPALVAAVTDDHAAALEQFMAAHGLGPDNVDLVSFHGQTVLHRPQQRFTLQLGDGRALATRLGIPVMGELRQADVQAGGQGAPIAPAYHAALARGIDHDPAQPIAFLNIGGVANLTWILGEQLAAFDTGPGNALLDDWLGRHGAGSFDAEGRIARSGRVDPARLRAALASLYFYAPWPKSLDRNDFTLRLVDGLGLADGAATLVALTAAAVAKGCDLLPAPPVRWLVTGGGRHNPAIMAALAERLRVPVQPVEAVGLDGDALEAEAMAFLGIRALHGLPLTFPGTTGVARPLGGGTLHRPERA